MNFIRLIFPGRRSSQAFFSHWPRQYRREKRDPPRKPFVSLLLLAGLMIPVVVDAGNVPPTISEVSPISMPENSTNTLQFSVSDPDTPLANLIIQAESTNETLIPGTSCLFFGMTNRLIGLPETSLVTLSLVPKPFQTGDSDILITLTDPGPDATNLVSSRVHLTVTPVNVPPTISRLDAGTMVGNTTAVFQFVVSDADTPLSNLVILATSDNATLIPSTSLTFFNCGTNQLFGLPANNTPHTSLISLNVTPTLFKSGRANITIKVTDPLPEGTNIVSSTFQLTVSLELWPPFFIISPGPQSVAAGGQLANVPFAIASGEFPANALTMSAHSSDQTLVKDSNITFTSDASGTNRRVNITAESTATGTTIITLTITAPTPSNNSQTSTNFTLTVRPSPARMYTNSAPITIMDNSPGQPYHSTISVNGLYGPIANVTVTLDGFTHNFPSDVGVLLVGPAGQKIVLQNNAGGGTPVSNLRLIFDQAATSAIPQSALTSGTYRPTDYRGISFRGSAPAGPYTNTLDALNGTNPNGTWSLYVEDFDPPDSGMISNGWGLAINTDPVIVGLFDLTGWGDTPLGQNFTVRDDLTWNSTYKASAKSDNQNVVSDEGVVLTDRGTNWTVTVIPIPNPCGTWGAANITITMVNEVGQQARSTFKVVFMQNSAPFSFLPIPDQIIFAGGLGVVTLLDDCWHSPSQLGFSFQSSNTNLVPNENLKMNGTKLLVWPAGTFTGTTRITVTASSPIGPWASVDFLLNVVPNPLQYVFADTRGIVINDTNPATPFPSTIEVAGLYGSVTHTTATLLGIQHAFPADVSILLVGPQSQKVVLMSRTGGSASLSNTRITFDDAATALLPQFTLIADGIYQPTDYKSSDTFFSGAPAPPYSRTLSVFNGTNPNGIWSLFVQDDQGPDAGLIAGGWLLTIATLPAPPPLLSLTQVGHVFKIKSSGSRPNATFTLQSTADLNTWSDVKSTTTDGSGSAEFDIILSNGPPRQFYRVLTW